MAGKHDTQRIRYSFLKILTGSDLSRRRLALMEAASPEPGPVVWVTACAHGDEVGGIAVVQELFRRLRRTPLRRGRLCAFPLMNPTGFEMMTRHLGVTQDDLNRAFPGDANGSLAQRIAHLIFTAITETAPRLVIDLHNDWIKSIPYVVIDPPPAGPNRAIHTGLANLSRETGFVVVNEQENDSQAPDLRRTLSGSLVHAGVPAITLELGEAHIVNEAHVAAGVAAVLNMLAALGMTDPVEMPPSFAVPGSVDGVALDYSHGPAASTSGIIRFAVRPGQVVRRGDRIARIHNVFGKLRETLCATHDGIVLGHADSSVAMPGRPVAAFGLFPRPPR
jgi:predicted deacylase